MLRHRALYIYRCDPGQTEFRLSAVRLPAPPSDRVRPAYAGLVEDVCLTPVPLRLDAPASEPRRWRECGEHWLDLPAGPGLLLRFRVWQGQRFSARRLEQLTRWAATIA